MNFERIKLRHLRCLAAVGQERNLVRAARVLAQTQPAVSKTVAELEDIVGRRLLVRQRRGVDLTPAGEVLARHAVATLRGLHEGLALALDETDEEPLRVAVGALPNVASGLLPDAIARLQGAHRASRIRLVSGTNAQLMRQLREGEIDLVVGRLAQSSAMADLEFVRLFDEPLVLAARPGHPLAGRQAPGFDALTSYPMVLPVSGTLIRDTADAFLFAHAASLPEAIVEATDTMFAIGLLLRTDSVWFAPRGAVRGSLESGALVRLPFDTRSTAGPIGVTVRRHGDPSKGASRMIAAIRAALPPDPMEDAPLRD